MEKPAKTIDQLIGIPARILKPLGVLLLCIFSGLAVSKVNDPLGDHTFSTPKGKITFKAPKNYRHLEGLFGVPHMLMTPKNHPVKTSISFYPSGYKGLEIDSVKLEKEYETYKKGRYKWADGKGALISGFFPYEYVKFQDSEVHKVGVHYKLNKIHFHEHSFFINCTGMVQNFVHVKSLTNGEDKDIKPLMDKLAESLACLE